MARRGENIYKRLDGRWEGRYIYSRTAEGKAIYKSVYAHTYSEVKDKLKNKPPNKNKPESTVCGSSLDSYADKWLLSVRMKCRISTYNKYKNTYNNYIKPVLCQFKDIDFTVVEQIMIANSRLSAKTQSDILTVLRSVCDFAVQNGYSCNFDIKNISVREEDTEMRVLSIDEQRIFSDYLLNSPDLKKIGIYLCLFTGIRIGELCALRYENIALEKGVLSIRKTMQRVQVENKATKTEVIITEPKSKKSVRDIPLPEGLVSVINKWYINLKPTDYILTGKSNRYVEPRSMEYCFKKCISECGISDANFHALRHTFATRCVEAGFDIKTLSEILGHTNVIITLNRYVHSSMDLKRNNMDKLNALMIYTDFSAEIFVFLDL